MSINIGGSVNFRDSSSLYDCPLRKTPLPAVDLSRENLLTFDSEMTIYSRLFHSPPTPGSLKLVSLLGCDITLFFIIILWPDRPQSTLVVTFYHFVILLGCDITLLGCGIGELRAWWQVRNLHPALTTQTLRQTGLCSPLSSFHISCWISMTVWALMSSEWGLSEPSDLHQLYSDCQTPTNSPQGGSRWFAAGPEICQDFGFDFLPFCHLVRVWHYPFSLWHWQLMKITEILISKVWLCRESNPGLLAIRAWCANHYTTESELLR